MSLWSESIEFAIKYWPESMKPSFKGVVTFLVALLLGGGIVMGFGQVLIPSLRMELNALHTQDSLFAKEGMERDSLLAKLTGRWDNKTGYDLSKSRFLSREEQGRVLSWLLNQRYFNVDSLQDVIVERELQELLERQ